MLKVMLADTDADIIKNFKTYIKLAFPDIRVVGSVGNPANFLNGVKDMKPDLIIADIRFFGTAALQTIRDTYEFFPDKRFIIYGTYSDADYKDRIMEFGVIDYIYRPVKPVDLEKSLAHAIKAFEDITRLNAARDKLVNQYQADISMFRDRFLNGIMEGYISDENEILSSFKYFGINVTPGYCVFTLRIDHFKTIILTMDEMEKHLLVYKILQITNERLKKINNGAAVVNRLNTISALIGGSMPLYDAMELCESVRMDILHQAKINTTAGLGRVYQDVKDITVSYRESDAALRYRYFMGYGAVIPIHFVEPHNNITYRYPLDKEQKLVYSAVTGEYEYCRVLLKDIFDALKQCEPLPERLLSKMIMDILFSINRFASEQHLAIESTFTQFFPSREAVELKTADEAFAYMDGALKSFCAFMIDLRNNTRGRIVKTVKAYIDKHYTENISLADMAVYAETTPEFLNNAFASIEEKSVYQYALSVRMENAGSILRTTKKTIDEVAAEMGYDDIKHFNAVFKQYMSVTPLDYRLRER